MIVKHRQKPKDLTLFEALAPRMNFSKQDRQHFLQIKNGYEGEIQFDHLSNELTCDCLILQDLLLSHHNTTFQLDTVIITADTIYLLNIKNHQGEYIYDSDNFIKLPRTKKNNPLYQLQRSQDLFQSMLSGFKYTLPTKSLVIFINPEFTLYQATLDKPFVLPTQVRSFIRKLNRNSTGTISESHRMIADYLLKSHMEDSPFNNTPDYNYDQLRKGILCATCRLFYKNPNGKYLKCSKCAGKEDIADAVIRTVKEFKLLFPKDKVTTNQMQDWSGIIQSKKMIRRILSEIFQVKGYGQWTYYE